jgi:hypothetical protein
VPQNVTRDSFGESFISQFTTSKTAGFEPIASEPRMAHRLLKVQERYEQ